jgi:predicted SnoaL-like aldol condensation-catalyzing enzyme
MMIASLRLACAALVLFPFAASAKPQGDPVVASGNPEALFVSKDRKLHRNKQAALRIVRDLLEAGHWELAPELLTERYVQHNPAIASGRAEVVHFFVDVLKVRPGAIPARIRTRIVAVQADGDFVTVSSLRELPDPADPARTYTTTWFDMWRFKDGKADEHWDPATLEPPG